MKTNVPLLPDALWIDRPQLLSELERLLQGGARLLLIDTVAPHGNGKTTLLSQLYWALDSNGTFKPIWLSIDRFRLAQPDHGPELAVEDEYLIYRDLLYSVMDSMAGSLKLGRRSVDEFAKRAAALQEQIILTALSQDPNIRIEKVSTGGISVGAGAHVNCALTTGSIVVDMGGVYSGLMLSAVNTLRSQVADEFIARMIDITRKTPYVLLVDEFCRIIGKRAGIWFLDVLERLDSISVVLARSVTPEGLERRDFVRDFALEPFSVQEVDAYLQKRFSDRPGLDLLSTVIHDFSHGHPGTLALAVDAIHEDELDDMDELVDFFTHISTELVPDDPRATILEQKYDRMIEEVLCDIREKDSELEPALYAAAVLRSYTRDVMEGVLSEPDEDTDQGQNIKSPHYSRLAKRLGRYSFVDELAHKRNEKPVYMVQNLVRRHLGLRLQEEDPGLYAEIHERARDYYLGQMSDYKEKEAKKVYVGNYRLEKQNWQEYCIEWLYHVSAGDDRAAARLHFAREYFEAFNWWNWFLPFEYSELLLEMWQQVASEEEDLRLLELLCQLDQSYPKGYDKHGYRRDWIAARTSLMNLKLVLGLGAQIEELSPDARTVLGFIEWFIAQSYQFGAPQRFDKAEQYFQSSRVAFEAEEDLWNLIWTDSYMADLYMEMGLRDKAVGKVEASLQAATSGEMESFDDQDHEVISQSYRILGDVYWSAGELGPAFREYARAVFHAYVFNAIPIDADLYSTTLYASVCKHVAGRLLQLVDAKRRPVARTAAEYLLDFWNPYWELCEIVPDRGQLAPLLEIKVEEALDTLASLLFPPVPKSKDECRLIVVLGEEMRWDVKELDTAPIAQAG